MSSSAAGGLERASSRAPLVTTLFFLTPFLTAISPRLAPFLLLLLGLALVALALRRGLDWRRLLQPNPASIALILVALYALLSATWAANPLGAASKSSLLLAATFVTFASVAALPMLQDEEVERAARAVVAGSLCGAVFVLIELLTHGALTRAAMNSFTAFRPDRPKHMTIRNGMVARINTSEFNQNVAMLSFQLWPGLLALTALQTGKRRTLLAVLYFLILAVPIVLSQHDSSQVALVVALPVFALAWKWPRQIVTGLAVAWCLGFMLVLPADFLVYKAELHRAEWLPKSARARIIIWDYTAERVLEHPWLGIGADSTARVKAERITPPEQPEGFVYKRTTGQHAHSIFLQAWYELGVAGAILLAVAGAAVALRIDVMPRAAQPFAAAAFVTFAAIAAFAWGIWQIWLICAVALMAVNLGLGACSLREERKDQVSSEESPATR